MKILSDDHRTPTRTKRIELDTDEWKRSDHDVITAADNGGRWDEPAHHFGGRVERGTDGKTAVVYIYND